MEYNNVLYEKYKKNNTSQYGEDGIVEEIFKRLNIQKGICVDIGASNGKWYSNTFSLVEKGWEAYEIEGSENEELKKLAIDYPNIKYRFCYVSDEDNERNINKLLKQMDCPKEIDFMSLDIDSIEYWIWDTLEYNPKIMCIEIEPRNYPTDMIFHDRNPKLSKSEKQKLYNSQNLTGFGPMYQLAKKKGYFLICHTISNLFFIRNDLIQDLKYPEVTDIKELTNFNPLYLSTEDKRRWKKHE